MAKITKEEFIEKAEGVLNDVVFARTCPLFQYETFDEMRVAQVTADFSLQADYPLEDFLNALYEKITSDVVERSEYDNLHNLAKSWLEEKKELEKANDELRSKIDKTIEEIKHCKVYGHTDCARLVSLPEVLTILKRNIYEEEKIKWNYKI